MDGMMTWHIVDSEIFFRRTWRDLGAAGSEGISLQTVTTGGEDRGSYGLRARDGLGWFMTLVAS